MIEPDDRLDYQDRRIEWVNDHTWRWGYWHLRLSGPRRMLSLGSIDRRDVPFQPRPPQEPVKPVPQ
ncbi:hypothetical protein BH23CHL1_BH23CHL1_26840 [soil metagenome]